MPNLIAVLISCLSLAVAVTSLYFSSLRQEDYLKVSIVGPPHTTFDPEKSFF